MKSDINDKYYFKNTENHQNKQFLGSMSNV